MQWEKKICIRLTTRRILGAVLTASTVVNLVIVGVAFEAAAPTPTATPTEISLSTTQSQTATSIALATTANEGITPSSSPTTMLAPMDTPTQLPTLALCVLRSYWPIYRVQPGDTLFSLARVTGSTDGELRLANCLPDNQLYPGQLLYVPRLPSITVTPSSTAPQPPTATPPHITITPTDSPTMFKKPSLCYYMETVEDKETWRIRFDVTVSDVDGIRSVGTFYKINESTWNEISMNPGEAVYSGSGDLANQPSTADSVTYQFRVKDALEHVIDSEAFNSCLIDCYPLN